jgi:plastocyanin
VKSLLLATAVVVGVAALEVPTSRHAQKPASQSHVVRLESNRFVPAETRVAGGDTVRFVNGEGGPHNVEFISDSIPEQQRRLIDGAMTGKIRALSSPMLILRSEEYRLVIPALPAGRYAFLCSPHAANMHGALVISQR